MPTANLAQAVSTVARLLAILPALWFAGQLLPRTVDALPAWAAGLARSRGSMRFALWLVLGSLFTAPLIDLIEFLFSLIEILSPTNWSAQPSFTAGFGSAPVAWYLILNDIVILVVYGLMVWAGRRFLAEQRERGSELFEMSAVETAFVLLMGGAVVNRAVSLTMLSSMEAPFVITAARFDFGPAGFLASWGAGLVLVVIILGLMYRTLPDLESTSSI
jgi:hypothetical protein